MYSTRCNSCRQLINLKNEEIIDAVAYAEANGEKLHIMNCPKCRKPVKLQVSQLRLKLPRRTELTQPSAVAGDSPETTSDETPDPTET